MRRSLTVLTLVAASLGLGACSYSDPYYHTSAGALLGGATGAVIGHQLDGKDGRYVGGAAGALLGGAVGHYADHQRLQYETQRQAYRIPPPPPANPYPYPSSYPYYSY